MLSKRLISLVPRAKLYIAIDVVFQWLALLANIVLFILIGIILQELVNGTLIEDRIAALHVP